MTYNADLALQDKQSRYTVGENNYLIPFWISKFATYKT